MVLAFRSERHFSKLRGSWGWACVEKSNTCAPKQTFHPDYERIVQNYYMRLLTRENSSTAPAFKAGIISQHKGRGQPNVIRQFGRFSLILTTDRRGGELRWIRLRGSKYGPQVHRLASLDLHERVVWMVMNSDEGSMTNQTTPEATLRYSEKDNAAGWQAHSMNCDFKTWYISNARPSPRSPHWRLYIHFTFTGCLLQVSRQDKRCS